jgi:hypothetical protein
MDQSQPSQQQPDIQFVRVTEPAIFQLIPRRLFEDLPGVGKERVDDLYRYAMSLLTVPAVDQQGKVVGRIPNEVVHVAILVDDVTHVIKGVVWAQLDLVEQHIFIQALSLDKDLRTMTAQLHQRVMDYLFALTDGLAAKSLNIQKKLVMATDRPKTYIRHGWTKSPTVLLEYVEPKANTIPITTEAAPIDETPQQEGAAA